MTAVTLRPCRAADLPTLMTWFADEGEALRWGGPLIYWPLRIDDLLAMLAEAEATPPARRCWSAFAGDSLVGHGQVVYDWEAGAARLARIAIAPDRRGGGLGRALLAALIARLRAEPAISRIRLNVYAHNTRALTLYRSLGFAVVARRSAAIRTEAQAWESLTMELAPSAATDASSNCGRLSS